MMRWLGRNFGTFVLAFLLALVVWISAVLSTDPNEQQVYPRPITIKIVGMDPGLLLMEERPKEAQLTIIAPRSIWNRLLVNQDLLSVWADLSGLGPGSYVVPLNRQVSLEPARVVGVDPEEVHVVLEALASQVMEVKLQVTGEPALGYRRGNAQVEPSQVTVSGPQSLVSRVSEVHVVLDVSGANDVIERVMSVRAYDANGSEVNGITISPATVLVRQPITLLGGYRNVVVKVVTRGQVANGYWLTNISVTPPNVTVFSVNPQQVNSLPGFVETDPIDLTGLHDDTDIRATLNLPEGVTLAGEESVLVRLSIAALEGSLPISLPIEVVGLSPELSARVSPESVELLLTGPLTILNNLSPASIRVSLNVAGLKTGVYQLNPVVDLLPPQVKVASIMPEIVEATITIAPTPTPTTLITPRPLPTPTPRTTPTPRVTPTRTPRP